MNRTPSGGLSGALLSLASRLAPAERSEWVEAMRPNWSIYRNPRGCAGQSAAWLRPSN